MQHKVLFTAQAESIVRSLDMQDAVKWCPIVFHSASSIPGRHFSFIEALKHAFEGAGLPDE